MMNEDTLEEAWHTHLSWLGVSVYLTIMFLITIGILSVVIIYTPIVRHILPGYSESIRQQLIEETSRIDSLETSLSIQRKYLSVMRDVMAGEIKSDTIQSLDSMQIIMREQLLEAKNDATADFVAQYESKEKDNLQLFDTQQTIPLITFSRPANGVIITQYSLDNKQYGIEIKTAPNEAITSVLSGKVLYTNYEINNTYTMIIQHGMYISVYRNLKHILKQAGQQVDTGESIAIGSEQLPLYFELWHNGENINPEEVIVF